MAFGEIAGHLLGPAAGQPALYAVVAMGAVFASAARARLTAVACPSPRRAASWSCTAAAAVAGTDPGTCLASQALGYRR
jgi:hypothetical protein